MGNIVTKDGEVQITGVPGDWDETKKKELLSNIRATGKPFTGTYEDTLKVLEPKESLETYVPPEEAEATFIGGVDAFTRGAAPMLLAGAAGAVAGAPFAGVGAIPGAAMGMAAYGITEMVTPTITNFLNEKFGTNEVDAKTGWQEIFTKLGVENPDTAAEKVAMSSGEAVSDTLAMIMGGNALQTGTKLGQSIFKDIGKIISYKPVSQLTGAAASVPGATYGGQGTEAIAGALGAGEKGKAIANVTGQVLGGIGADLAVGGIGSLVDNRLIAGTTPMSTKAAQLIEQGDTYAGPSARDPYNPEVTRSEVVRNEDRVMQKELNRAQARETRTGGSGQLHYDRHRANQRILSDYMQDKGVELDGLSRDPGFAKELTNDFINTRQAELTEAVGMKQDILNRFDTNGQPVYTQGTVELINDTIATFNKKGSKAYDPIVDSLVDWREQLIDRSINDVNDTRRIIGDNMNNTDLMVGGVQSQVNPAIRKVYNSLADEMNDAIYLMDQPSINQYEIANQKLTKLSEEFESEALFKLFKEGDKNPDNIDYEKITDLLTSASPSQVERVYGRLSANGQDLAKTAVMTKVFQESNPQDLSPSMFAKSLEKRADQLGVVLDAEDYTQAEGLRKWFDSTAYSENFARSEMGTHTPSVNVSPGSGIAASQGMRKIGSTAGVSLGVLTTGLMGKLANRAESPKIRNMVASLANAEPGSPQEAEIIKRLTRLVNAMPATNQTDNKKQGVE